MSRQGLIAAHKHATILPAFSDLAEARSVLLQRKEAVLATFVASRKAEIGLDFSPESLKRLEAWYFRSGMPDSVADVSVSSAIGFYFGEVLVRNAAFEWVVEAFPFEPARFTIGVAKCRYGLMLTAGMLPSRQGNKRQQSLWRQWRRIAL